MTHPPNSLVRLVRDLATPSGIIPAGTAGIVLQAFHDASQVEFEGPWDVPETVPDDMLIGTVTDLQQTLLKQVAKLYSEIMSGQNSHVVTRQVQGINGRAGISRTPYPGTKNEWVRWKWLENLLVGAGMVILQGPPLSDELLAWFYMTESPDYPS